MRFDAIRIRVSVLLTLSVFSGIVCADELTDKAKTLLQSSKAAEAYELLEPMESARAGEVEYDFLLGLAALDVGQNTRAVFALERVLAIEPNNVRARAEIARAYLALGETQTAEQEFSTVKKQGVPADVSQTIDRYIASMRRIDDQNKPTLNGYVEAFAGYDTNVNVGPNRNSVAIPGFGGASFTLSPDSRANGDWFGGVGAGANLRVPLGGGVALLAGLAGSERFNFHKSQFDTETADANVGATAAVGSDVFTVMAQAGVVTVESDRFRNAKGVTAQWQRNLDARNQVGAFVQYADLHYRSQDVRDADRWVAGATYAHLWRDGLMGFASAYFVSEDPQKGAVNWLGFEGIGVRVGGRLNLDAQTVVFGGLNYEYRGYSAVDPSFNSTRHDNQYAISFGATRYLAKEWAVTPQLTLTRNESNQELYGYRREMFSVSVRREF